MVRAGIGDTLNWVSRLSLIISQADHCILECQEKLVPLLKRSFPDIELNLKIEVETLKEMTLMFIYQWEVFTSTLLMRFLAKPQVDPYLIPDPVRVNYWKERLKFTWKRTLCWYKLEKFCCVRLPSSTLSSYN